MWSQQDFITTIVAYIPVQLSLSVHEWAHARVAFALGDDTAARQGRLTLNPFVHLDLMGTIIPLLGIPFGWAKPVPVNPANFRSDVPLRRGMMLTAAAGPLSNLCLSILCCALLAAIARFAPLTLAEARGLQPLLGYAVIVNLALAAFNLLPVYPLDGSRIVDGIVPEGWRAAWERMAQFSPFILLMIILTLPRMHYNPFGWVHWIGTWMLRLALGLQPR